MSQSGTSDSLSVFCREVRNLLRSKPNCMIPFSKFVPAYHNHYGRQCCVYQFGYTKLIELLEAIPHVVQIIGDGTNRYITLTHREQIKRFASDLIKVVKSQPGKKLKLSQFANAYEMVLGRVFKVEDYGTNNINVLLAEIWEGTINIMPIKREFVDEKLVPHALFVNGTNGPSSSALDNSNSSTSGLLLTLDISSNEDPGSASNKAETSNSGHEAFILNQLVASCELVNKPYITEQYPDAWFEIPKRERSDKEIKRTKYFVWDVIELLSNMSPNYSVPFSKFIPSYHYYFNRQCKVSIFGFSKLIDLFESISPDVVEIIDQGPGEEKVIKLAAQHVPKGRPQSSRGRSRHHHHSMNSSSTSNNNNNNTNCGSTNNISGNVKPPVSISYGSNATYTARQNGLSRIENDSGAPEYDSDDDSDYICDDIILPVQSLIDSGPSEQELMELEDELEAYEQYLMLQGKRSNRMAATLDLFKYSIY